MPVPLQFLNRHTERCTLAEIPSLTFPMFIKSFTPKQFRGAVYEASGAVFVSEPVTFTAEVRTFLPDGNALDAGVHEGASQVTGGAIPLTTTN